MDNRTADSEYYRKAARVFHTLRYVVLLILIVFVVIGFTVFKRELTYENFRYIMRYVNFNLSSDYSDTNNLTYVADDGAVYGYLKGDLAVLSPKGFVTYDFSGSELIYKKLAFPNPCLKTAGKYALCYDISGKSLEVFNSYSNVIEKQFDYPIKDACIRSDGSYAVSYADKYLRSKVTVFEPDGEFTYETRDKEVVAVSLPEESNKVNFIAMTVNNGDFRTILLSYNTREEKSVFEKEFIGEFPLRLYSSKDMVCMLTDKTLYFIDYDGKIVKQYSHDTQDLASAYMSGGYIAVAYSGNVINDNMLKIFDFNGEHIVTEYFDNDIISFSAYENKLYALEKGKLNIIDIREEGTSEEENSTSAVETDGTFTEVFATAADEYVLVSKFGAKQISG